MPQTEYGSFMNVGEFKKAIQDLPDDMIVVIQEDTKTRIFTKAVEAVRYPANFKNDFQYELPIFVSDKSETVLLIH